MDHSRVNFIYVTYVKYTDAFNLLYFKYRILVKYIRRLNYFLPRLTGEDGF